jgi:ADP-heptose:LPS heptosyltransferase
MELRPGLGFKSRFLNIACNYGGFGDMLARLPAIKFMREQFPHVTGNVYWHDYFVPLAEFLLPSTPTLVHRKFSDLDKANKNIPLVDFTGERLTSLSLHLVDHAFLILMDRVPEADQSAYIKAPLVPLARTDLLINEPYVILTCGFTSKTREWQAKHINATALELRKRGITPVFLGSEQKPELGNESLLPDDPMHDGKAKPPTFDSSIDYSVGVNLINKTSLIEALGVIQGATAIMGVDNGLLHLASCTNTAVVWGFTSLEPRKRLPLSHGPQGIVFPVEKLSCFGCQSKAFNVNHDWRRCPFGDYQCLEHMTADKFMSTLEKIIPIP